MMQPSVTVSEQRSAPAERKRTFATIPQTSQDNYITDMWALNLWDSDNEGGDWHARMWRMSCVVDLSQEDSYPWRELGDDRLRDCRAALAWMGHPAGKNPKTIWGAHHDRAIMDKAWNLLHVGARSLMRSTVCPSEVAAWLWSDEQFEHLHRMGRLLEQRLVGERQETWSAWLAQLTPNATYD